MRTYSKLPTIQSKSTVAERKFYLDGLGQMACGFVDIFVQLAEVVIEKLYNAVVNAIYESINGLAGVALVAPFAAVHAISSTSTKYG
jgi:hypothetical protein